MLKASKLHSLIWAISLGLIAIPLQSNAQTSPEQFLGFRVGADRHLADYGQIISYFRKLSTESPRVQLVQIGTTTLNKPMMMAIVTSAENMKDLDKYRGIAHQLRDARNLSPEEAAKLAADGKIILAIGANIHSTEIASSQMAMELAYKLAVGDTPFDAEKVLRDVIILIVPSVNPDGETMVTDWYRKYLNTAFEGGRMPWLYHPYAGHDDNRDFYMFNLPETRAMGRVLYHDWLPQIFLDEHQTDAEDARQFIAPYADPTLPDVHPLVWRGIEVLGAGMRYDLESNGKSGVSHGEGYTGWWTGGEDEVSWPHNIVAMLTEGASARVASPIYIPKSELHRELQEVRMNFPHPWEGGWWRLRDLVDYGIIFNFSAIRTAYERKNDFLLNFYAMNRDGIFAPGGEGGYVISADQHDRLEALKMIEVLKEGGIEVYQADASFTVGGSIFPAGSYYVPLAQPYRPVIKTLLGPQMYPDMHQGGIGPGFSNNPIIAPYDNAGWTLPYLMGVSAQKVDDKITVQSHIVDAVSLPEGGMDAGDFGYVVLDCSQNASYAVVAHVLTTGVQVQRALDPLPTSSGTLPAGAFVIPITGANRSAVVASLRERHVHGIGVRSRPTVRLANVRAPRIGIYQSYARNMDEGWTRYALDDLGTSYHVLHNADFQGTSKKRLIDSIDVLVFPDEAPDVIIDGLEKALAARPGAGGVPSGSTDAVPPPFEGGIGKPGLQAIRDFVRDGGRLITVNQAAALAMSELGAPAIDALKNVKQSEFFAPNSIVHVSVDPTSPLGFGMPKDVAAMFSDSIAMQTTIPSRADIQRSVPATYSGINTLMSGWMIGSDRLADKAAVVDARLGKGRIALIGFKPIFRAQSHGTYKLLLNALFYPEDVDD